MIGKRTYALVAVIISLLLMVVDVAVGISRCEASSESDGGISEELPADREGLDEDLEIEPPFQGGLRNNR